MNIGQRYGETNTGRKRRRNEDAFVCEPPLFAVADGMGGAQAGEIASSLAAAALTGALEERDNITSADAQQLVVRLVQEANRRVHERATHDSAASGMGTTMTVALVGSDGDVTIGHVGDSRAYRLRGGALVQLTDDHSLVAELVRRGELTPAEAEIHPQRSVITRALGTDPEVDVDVFVAEGLPGDVFLLCSDGLSTMLDADTISRLVDRNRADLRGAARALIDAANDVGGEDNITAVLFEIVQNDPAREPIIADPAPPADEEDTLHPEDRVALPIDPSAPATDTMVVSAEDWRGAAASAEDEDAPLLEPIPLLRLFLATALIVALVAAIVALSYWGLTR
jgi:serine/threonine protein phosphatase PrpC